MLFCRILMNYKIYKEHAFFHKVKHTIVDIDEICFYRFFLMNNMYKEGVRLYGG